jgi:hypothetical protein
MQDRINHPSQWVKAWIALGVPKRMHMTLVALGDAWDRREKCVWKGQKAMASEWALDRRTFQRHLDHLEASGVILRAKRRRKNGSYTSDRISLLPPDIYLPATRRRDDDAWSEPPGVTMVTPAKRHDGDATSPSSGVTSPEDPLAPLGVFAAGAAMHTPDASIGEGSTDDAGGGVRDCTCEEPRRGRFVREGRRWCLECGGYELVAECNVCGQEKPGRWLAGMWVCEDGCRELVEEDLQRRAVAVEGVAADPLEEAPEGAEAVGAEVQRRVDAVDVAAGAAAGDERRAGGHGR